MKIRDDIARVKLADVRESIERGNDFTKPWLDLDVEAYGDYRKGRTDRLPDPYGDDPVDRTMMEHVRGMRVLCLAGSGGQQSAVFSLLGATVTVLDLCPEQLDSDQKAARHYGYEVTTIQGDMRDLSEFPSAHFDRVYQPISTLFVPNLREVYSGVARVLKAGGLYFADYAVPLLYMAENREWDGTGYGLYITEPYVRGAILETEDEKLNFSHGESCSEFHHLLSDIINGLVEEQLMVRGVWENPRPGHGPPLAELEPGSELHRERYLPFGLSVVAERTDISRRSTQRRAAVKRASAASIRGVLFDLDNTLVDREASIRRYAEAFLRDFGQALPSTPIETIADRLVLADSGGYRGRETMLVEVLAWPEWRVPPEMDDLDRHWMWEFPPLAVAMPDMVATLDALARRGLKLGIITNGSARAQHAKIMALHLWRYCPVILVSEVVGLRKPDAAIFAMALDGLGIPPVDAWFVGDHPKADVIGAEQAGLTGVWMTGYHQWPVDRPEPALRIGGLSELPGLLESSSPVIGNSSDQDQ